MNRRRSHEYGRRSLDFGPPALSQSAGRFIPRRVAPALGLLGSRPYETPPVAPVQAKSRGLLNPPSAVAPSAFSAAAPPARQLFAASPSSSRAWTRVLRGTPYSPRRGPPPAPRRSATSGRSAPAPGPPPSPWRSPSITIE